MVKNVLEAQILIRTISICFFILSSVSSVKWLKKDKFSDGRPNSNLILQCCRDGLNERSPTFLTNKKKWLTKI